jgi:hypothetical protein
MSKSGVTESRHLMAGSIWQNSLLGRLILCKKSYKIKSDSTRIF